MVDKNRIIRATLAAQARFFRTAESEHDLTRKAISIDTGIPTPTLGTWENGTVMPAWALNAFAKAGYPDELLSILTEPGKREIVTPVEADGGDLDALGREAAGFVADKLNAEADGNVTPIEGKRLRHRATRLVRIAQPAAA